jgi:predicted Zn-dependent protease
MPTAWRLALPAALLFACSSSGGQPSRASVYAASTKTVVIEVDYAAGAEPYTGSIRKVNDMWDIFRANAKAVFGGTKTITVPSTLAEMEKIEVSGDTFTSEQVLAIAEAHRQTPPMSNGTASYYFVWLDGYYMADGQKQKDVLGVSIGDSGVLAMFKPVIESTDLPLFPGISRFVEQSTLVHEFGHAVGLVNNGIPMAQPHQDTAHGAHCTNDKCVMYWAVEGVADAVEFAKRYYETGETVMFAADCLADTLAELKKTE